MRCCATGSGRILAHLQETQLLSRLASTGGNPVGLAMQAVKIVQTEQVKAGIAILQNIGIANLALTGLGIGVSVAGFAIMSRKLDRIEKGMGDIATALARVERKLDGVRDHLIRQELSDLRAELRRIDDAWEAGVRDPGQTWRLAAERLLTIEERFLDHARMPVTTHEGFLARDLMIEAYTLAAEGRCAALMASDDGVAAERAARRRDDALTSLTGRIGTAQLLHEMLSVEAPDGLAERADAMGRLRPEAEMRAAALREREAMAATMPLTIVALREAGISVHHWLARARIETEAPLICLSMDEPADPVPA